MWYFIWILETFLACGLAIISALFIEKVESDGVDKIKHIAKRRN